MKFSDFEKVISANRLKRYLNACGGDKRKVIIFLLLTNTTIFVVEASQQILQNDFVLHKEDKGTPSYRDTCYVSYRVEVTVFNSSVRFDSAKRVEMIILHLRSFFEMVAE